MKERTFKAAMFTTDGNLTMVDLPHDGWFDKGKKMLGIEMAELPCRKINGKSFDFMCDEEGLFNNPQPTLLTDKGEVLLVGNILIMHPYTMRGEKEIMSDLTAEEFKHIEKCLSVAWTSLYGTIGVIAGGDYE